MALDGLRDDHIGERLPAHHKADAGHADRAGLAVVRTGLRDRGLVLAFERNGRKAPPAFAVCIIPSSSGVDDLGIAAVR